MLQPTHYLALWMPTGELIACVPIGEHLQFHHDALTHLLDDPAAYDHGVLAVYPVALTDDPDDMPPGFDYLSKLGRLHKKSEMIPYYC